MSERLRATSAAIVLLFLALSVLVVLPPRVSAASKTWTTDEDFNEAGALFQGTGVVGTGVPARIDIVKENMNWEDQAPSDPPSAREGPGLAYSPDDNVAVLFGGYGGNDLSDTWEYDYPANAWTETTGDPMPPGRESPGLSYDPVERVAVLFGGLNSTDGLFLNDTWEYDVGLDTWAEQSPPTSPPPLADSVLVYYAGAARHVIVGQSLVTGQMVTWAYDAATHAWENLNPGSSPSPRSGFAVAYHAQRNSLVLFGGSFFTTVYAQTWEYVYGGSWAQVNAGTSPTARTGHAMTYRPAMRSVLLFGGQTQAGLSQETWRYLANQVWVQVSTTNRPPARQLFGLTFDTEDDVALLYGGRNPSGDPFNDTWALVAAYFPGGKYASAVFDSGAANVDWGSIWWNKTPANQPADTFLRFQIAAANSPDGPYNWSGPDGLFYTYYEDPGTALWSGLDGHEYLRFLADFGTNDTAVTPTLEDVTILNVVPPAPPYIVYTDPPNAAFGVPAGQVVHIAFSKPVNTSTLGVTFLLGPPVSFEATWSNGDRDVDLTHAEPFAENSAYQLLASVQDLNGSFLVPGPAPNPWTFTTEKINPKIQNTNPIYAQANVLETQPIFVNFSEPMDVDSVNVTITPDLPLDRVWTNGNASLRLDHVTPLTLCTHYTVEVNGTDPSGLPLVPGPTANPWTFLARCRDPYIVEERPPHQQMGVDFDTPIVVDFSEPMNATSVTLSIVPFVGGQSFDWSNGDTRLTVNHTEPFVQCGVYTVTAAGTDADEGLPLIQNPFQPFAIPNPWMFIAQCPNPFIFATFPAHNATDVPTDQEIWIIFSGGMNPDSVTWTVTGGPFFEREVTWDIVQGAYIGVHIQHLGWRQCSRYTIFVEGESGGRPLVPGFAPNPWSFDVVCISPYVTVTDPADGETQVPLDAPIKADFSEPMNTTSVVVSTAPLIALDWAWSNGNQTLTLTHAANYTMCTQYTVFLDGTGADGNGLLVGVNAPAAPVPWSFETWCPGFYLDRTDPVDNETGVPQDTNITVVFSRAADPESFQVTIAPPVPLAQTWSGNDTIVTLDPSIALADCTWYTVTVSAKDPGGNDLTNTTVSVPNPWRFKTVCFPPQILSTDPAAGAIDVPLDTPIVVEFSKPMDRSTVTATPAPLFLLVPSWTNNDTTLTLTHAFPFVPLTEYCLEVTGNDTQGNPLIRGPVPNPWCFTTTTPLPAPRGLEVHRAAPDIVLTWAPVVGANRYAVYESGDRFAPWPWAELGESPTTSFTAPGHESDGLTHFYIVRARAMINEEGANSTMGAKVPLSFSYQSDRTNVNWLSLPYRSIYRRASDISDELTSASIDVVGKWDPATQRSVLWYYFRGIWRGTDFRLDPGEGFFIGVRATFTWVVNGTDGAVPLYFQGRPEPNMDWVSLPYTSTYRTASDLVRDIEGGTGSGNATKIVEVGTWDSFGQRLLVYYFLEMVGWTGIDFPLAEGQAVYFKVISTFSWTPRIVIPEVP